LIGFTRRLPARPVLASQGASWRASRPPPTTSVGSSAILDAARLAAAPIAAVVAGSAVRRGRIPASSAASASEGASVGASVAVLGTCSAVLVLLVLLVLRGDCDGGVANYITILKVKLY
jgi:hypothetical protein